MDALRKTHSAMVPDGVVLDLRPLPGYDRVDDARGRLAGRVDHRPFAERTDLTDRGVAQAVEEGLLVPEQEWRFELCEHFDSADELIDEIDCWESATIPAASRRSLRRAEPPLVLRLPFVLRRLRVRVRIVLRKDAKLELLKRVPLFARLPRRALSELAMLADEIDIPQGKELTRQGASGREFFVIVEGEADVRRNGRKVNTMRAGDFFGEIALITGGPRTATVTATTPLYALVLTQQAFRSLLRRDASIQEKVLEALAERLPDEP